MTGAAPTASAALPPGPRVTHVTAPAPFGGLERVLTGLTRGLPRFGIGVNVVAVLEPHADEPPFLAAIRAAGVDVAVVRVGARAYAAERRLALAEVRRARADIVHTHGYRSDVMIGGVARRAGLATVSTLHGFTRQGIRGRAYEWVQVRSLRRADRIVAVSEALGDELRTRGIAPERLEVIRTGLVDDGLPALGRAEARDRLGLPGDGAIVGWVGRLSEEKDPALALRAFAALSERDARLAFVGDGPLRASLEAQASALGVAARVHFAGAVPHASSLLTAFDVLVCSSRTEGTPMVLLEAASGGVPIVATAVGGVPALLADGGGRLVPHGDPAEMARVIAQTLDAPPGPGGDSGLRARLLGPERDAWIDAYASLYRRVMAARAR